MNQQTPLFSIIIPLYNKEKYIANTLNSVLNQTYSGFEIIIVNDGSTDNSLKIVEGFTDPRIKVYSKKNEGVSAARNYGISKALNKYISFLDADDIWEPDFLTEIVNLINQYPTCGLYTSAYKKVKFNKVTIVGTEIPEGIIDNFFEVKLKYLVPWTSTVVADKKVFDDVGGFPIGMIGGEDDYTWAKIAIKYKTAFTPKVLAIFNETGSAVDFRKGKMDFCKESWFDFYKEGDFYRNELIAKKAIYAGIRYAYNSQKRKSKEIEKSTQFAVLSKKYWWKLFYLNRLPLTIIIMLDKLVNNLKRVKYKLTV